MKSQDDERFIAARDDRIRLEREVKLEHYQEKRLLEKINNLEMLRKAELDHQDQVRKRESDRLSRKAELEKDLKEWAVKLAKDEEQKEEAKKQEKANQLAEQKRWKQYHEKQKERIDAWYQHKD